MTRLVRAEVLKLMTVRTVLWITTAQLAFVAVSTVARVVTFSGAHTSSVDRNTAQFAASSILFALITGILVMAAESTYGTITQTLLVTPVRPQVVAAKTLVAATTGLALALVAEIATVVIGAPGGILDVRRGVFVLGGTLVGATLSAVLGVGLGSIFRGQGSAVAVSLVWLLIGESIVAAAIGHGVRYFPGHVFAATASGTSGGSDNVLGAWPAAAVAALYAAAFLGLGTALLSHRDV